MKRAYDTPENAFFLAIFYPARGGVSCGMTGWYFSTVIEVQVKEPLLHALCPKALLSKSKRLPCFSSNNYTRLYTSAFKL